MKIMKFIKFSYTIFNFRMKSFRCITENGVVEGLNELSLKQEDTDDKVCISKEKLDSFDLDKSKDEKNNIKLSQLLIPIKENILLADSEKKKRTSYSKIINECKDAQSQLINFQDDIEDNKTIDLIQTTSILTETEDEEIPTLSNIINESELPVQQYENNVEDIKNSIELQNIIKTTENPLIFTGSVSESTIQIDNNATKESKEEFFYKSDSSVQDLFFSCSNDESLNLTSNTTSQQLVAQNTDDDDIENESEDIAIMPKSFLDNLEIIPPEKSVNINFCIIDFDQTWIENPSLHRCRDITTDVYKIPLAYFSFNFHLDNLYSTLLENWPKYEILIPKWEKICKNYRFDKKRLLDQNESNQRIDDSPFNDLFILVKFNNFFCNDYYISPTEVLYDTFLHGAVFFTGSHLLFYSINTKSNYYVIFNKYYGFYIANGGYFYYLNLRPEIVKIFITLSVVKFIENPNANFVEIGLLLTTLALKANPYYLKQDYDSCVSNILVTNIIIPEEIYKILQSIKKNSSSSSSLDLEANAHENFDFFFSQISRFVVKNQHEQPEMPINSPLQNFMNENIQISEGIIDKQEKVAFNAFSTDNIENLDQEELPKENAKNSDSTKKQNKKNSFFTTKKIVLCLIIISIGIITLCVGYFASIYFKKK